MGAPSEHYVDPSLGSDTGDGTVGTPWGRADGAVVQYALDTITRDSTNGDRINIKAGGTDSTSAPLSLATYGAPTESTYLMFEGYTSTQGDGGIGVMSGGGSVGIVNQDTQGFMAFKDLELHNTGSNRILRTESRCIFYNLELHNATGTAIDCHHDCLILGCYFHNLGNRGVQANGSLIAFNVFENGTNDFVAAILPSQSSTACFNIIDIDGVSDGIQVAESAFIYNNTIYSNGGTGKGITVSGSARAMNVMMNNYVEGFSGTGGVGIQTTADDSIVLYGNNHVYNNATNFDFAGDNLMSLGADTVPGSSSLTDAASNDFTPTTALRALGIPLDFHAQWASGHQQTIDIGAVQELIAAGGSGAPGNMTGGLI